MEADPKPEEVCKFMPDTRCFLCPTGPGLGWVQVVGLPTTVPLGRQIIISTGKLYFSRCRSASF